jgi:hypothetical protein
MGLKGYRLWVMGQLDYNVQSPASSSAGVDASSMGSSDSASAVL